MCTNLARLVRPSLPFISFSKPRTLHFFEDDIAPKTVIPQPSRKAFRSTSQVSTTASVTSSGVMTRSMVKAAAVNAIKQSIWIVPSQSHKIPSLDSNLPKTVNKITSHPLKQRSVADFKIHQTISQGMDDLQNQANPNFQPFGVEYHGYTSSDSSPAFPRELVTQSKTKSSNSVIMAVMVTETTNLEEQLVNMKVTLERLAKENIEKGIQIKRQSKHNEEGGKVTIRILYQRLKWQRV